VIPILYDNLSLFVLLVPALDPPPVLIDLLYELGIELATIVAALSIFSFPFGD
jgi:hypothetical protein